MSTGVERGLSHANFHRRNVGLPLYAFLVRRAHVHNEPWNYVRCPYCGALHIHVGRNVQHQSRYAAPCNPSHGLYEIFDHKAVR